jgi:flagellar motor switch protein FliN/FliY
MDVPGTLAGDLSEEPEMVLIPCRIEIAPGDAVPFTLHLSTSMLESIVGVVPGGKHTPDRGLPPANVARPAEFEDLAPAASEEEPRNLGLLLDIPLEVRVELGRTKLKIQDVLELGNGSVVELDRLAGEPVDLLVNGKLFAKGEVVVIDENFGIRITDIVNITERLEALK